MFQVLLSWCWLGVSAVLWGRAFLVILEKVTGYKERALELSVLMGIALLTVYAQIFSLFYKVGMLASVVLLAVNLLLLFLLRSDLKEWLCCIRSGKGIGYRVFIIAIIFLLLLMTTATDAKHYDTALYHAQSIRWIEEYGIVKGLGNLHNRLAYNSSIFSLQALFSLRFLVGRSLHTVNGFVVALFAGYAICSLKIFLEKKIYASDFLRIGMLTFLFDGQNYVLISSPGSDMLAVGLVIYILIKWLSYLENHQKEIAPFAILCCLGGYAVSVKLSAAMIVLLVVSPAGKLIRQKKWTEILFYLFTGMLIVVPFLIRNVIISGYLLYPYTMPDFFRVDWKMPSYTLDFDRNEIKAWGWGLNDVYRFDASVTEWFPIWTEKLGTKLTILFWVNVIMIIPAVCIFVYQGIRKKEWGDLLVTLTIFACLALWFVGSPLPRYGSVFLTLFPLFLAGRCVQWLCRDAGGVFWKMAGRPAIALLILYIAKPCFYYLEWNMPTEIGCPDYAVYEVAEAALGDTVIYYPVKGDQAGYYAFPSTPYPARLQLIELRGGTVAGGFRMKEEYRDACVTTYGQIEDTNIFK